MREGDVDPHAFDLSRAEGRADFDDALRQEIRKIEDDGLRCHAGAMIREWRIALFAADAIERGA